MENYVGKRLDGRYEIMEVIGVGGMAVVYKAFDNIDHRIVAVKILKEEYLTNEEFKRRFRNESKAIAVLSHPNIVKIFDVSFGDAIQYIVMEYIEGITLKEYIKQQGVVDPREAVYFITQILRALKHAHDKGIVHRDIKPQNILLISDGTIKVTDFGIARFSENATRTMTDGAIGSVHYISPEQAKGSVTDARTDIYSAGVMLYEMLTGKLPFQSDNAVSVALMQLQNDPIKPREINPNIPEGLEEIIIRAMRKNPTERYQSANDMLSDIVKFKSNPLIVFGYSYFDDSAALRFDSHEEPKTTVPKPSAPVEEPKAIVPIDENDYDDDIEFDDKGRTKTIAVLCSVLAALAIFAVVLVTLFMPASNKVKVPDLRGLNFYNEVMNINEYSTFDFEPIVDEDSEEPSGTILSQDPREGSWAEPGSVITIHISGSASTISVPDVYGYEYTSASTVLRSKSFDVTIIKENSDADVGTVIRTSPAKNEKAEIGSLITLYVATNENVEPVDVPNLVGLTVVQAKAKLEDKGLVLDSSRTEYRPSSERAGIIIGHEYIGEQVKPGTSIAVYVSTGKPPISTTEEETTKASETTEKNTTKPPVTGNTTTTKNETSTTRRPTTEPTTQAPTSAPTNPTTSEPITVPSTTAPTTAAPTAPPSEPDVPADIDNPESDD